MMTVRRRAIGVLVAVVGLAPACGTEEGRQVASVTSTPGPTAAGGSVMVADAGVLPPMDVVASLGYPRDLLDRGRVNLKVSREDDTDLVILDKQLVAEHFTPAPIEQRRTVVPPDGRSVAVQALFGEVADCDSAEPVTASLVVTFTYGSDPTLQSTAIPVTDAAVLEDIRDRQCAVRRVLNENEIGLRNEVVDGETMSVDLTIRRRAGQSRLDLESIKGTVLFGVASAFESGDPERVLEPAEPELVVPIVIDVNRCDPHAVAETTRKFGVDLYVSIDGAEPQLVPVPITDLVVDLEAMLESCRVRADG